MTSLDTVTVKLPPWIRCPDCASQLAQDICVIVGTDTLICFLCALKRAGAGRGATVAPVHGAVRYTDLGFAPALPPDDAIAVLVRNGGELTRPVPAWVISQRRERGICEICGDEPAATEWAGTGQLIGWACEKRKRQGRNS